MRVADSSFFPFPGPGSAPALPTSRLGGHLREMRRDPLGLILRARREVGDLARLRMGPVSPLFVFHPDDVQHVLVGAAARYGKRTRGYDMIRLALGGGLLTSEGERWRRNRRIANPAFHRRALAGFAETMSRAALDTAAAWEAPAREDRAIDVATEMNRLTLRIAGETLFGCDLGDDAARIGHALTVMLEQLNSLSSTPLPYPEWIPTPGTLRLYAAVRELRAVVDRIVADRRRSGREEPDLLGMLLAARDEETGEGLSDVELRDEVLTLLLAGHETTANALAWTFWLLSRAPDAARRLEAEVDAVLGDRAPGVEDLAALPWTGQVFKEALRLYPPAWMIGRSALEDDEIRGHRVPAGTFVFVSPYAVHRHPAFWPEPEGFDPERWDPARARGRHPFAWLPFGGGQRKCIGDRFATMEATILLAVLARRFRLSLVPGHHVSPLAAITLRPAHGVQMTLRRRG